MLGVRARGFEFSAPLNQGAHEGISGVWYLGVLGFRVWGLGVWGFRALGFRGLGFGV